MHVERERQKDKYKRQDQLGDQEQLDRVDTWREKTAVYRARPNVAANRRRHRRQLDRAATAAFQRARLPRRPRLPRNN